MFVFKAAVVGAGTMGGQIAQTIAAAGIPVVLKDIDDELVQAGVQEARNVTQGQVAKLVERGRLTAEDADAQTQQTVGRIAGTTSYEGFGDVDFVIEAVPERMQVKQAVFAELDAAVPGHAILASNTSSLPITEIGRATLRAEKVIGFHYFYPASIMPLIEIVEGEETSAETTAAAVTFAQAIRKQPITCEEVPGFVVNRILNSGTSEVWREQEQKGLSIKKIDEGMGAAQVVPMGPYLLVNLLGLDTVLHVAEHLQESYGEERFYVPRGMQKLVADGKLGAKTGGDGFYDGQGEPNLPGDAEPDVGELVELLSLKTFLEACLVLEEGVATHRDIDFGMMAGAGLDPQKVWAAVKEAGVRALVIASSNPFLYSAGADIRAFTSMDESSGEQLINDAHELFKELGRDGVATIAAVNGLAFGGGCELAMACEVRIAARSALFGQPEIKLGIIPGFGGTQRLPRLVGQSKALEMNLVGDPILADQAFELGLANRVVEDHELLDTALAWARKLAAQAPLALGQIKRVSAAGDLDAGIEAEKQGFAQAFTSADAKEGIDAFLGKRTPRFRGA